MKLNDFIITKKQICGIVKQISGKKVTITPTNHEAMFLEITVDDILVKFKDTDYATIQKESKSRTPEYTNAWLPRSDLSQKPDGDLFVFYNEHTGLTSMMIDFFNEATHVFKLPPPPAKKKEEEKKIVIDLSQYTEELQKRILSEVGVLLNEIEDYEQ